MHVRKTKAITTKHAVMPHHVALLHQTYLMPPKVEKRDVKLV